MNKCTKCNTELKLMFSSYYCPNDCDRVSTAPPSVYTGSVLPYVRGLFVSVSANLEELKYKYPNMTSLTLHPGHITDVGLVHVSKLTNLTALSLEGATLHRLEPVGLVYLWPSNR